MPRAISRNALAGASKSIGQRQIGKAATSSFTYPLQAETIAYCKAGGGSLTSAFADLYNTFVYKAKKLGVWSVIDAGWFFCADTQNQALLNVKDPKTFLASISGTVSFTANKGFGNLLGGQVFFGGYGPSTSTTTSFVACTSTWANLGNFIGVTAGDYCVWQNQSSALYCCSPSGKPFSSLSTKFFGGYSGLNAIMPGAKGNFAGGGSAGSAESNYATTSANPHPIDGWIAAKFYVNSSATLDQAETVGGLIYDLILMIGALN